MRSATSLFALALLVTACGGGGGSANNTPTTPATLTPTITISTSAAALDITPGLTAALTVTVLRSGGFAGDVAVTVEGLPTGVTASALNITSANTSGTITLSALATALVAGSNLTVRGSGSGISSATASVALNVRAAAMGAVSVSFSPTSLTIIQGATVNVTATISRAGGFTGPVMLTVSGAPAGLTVAITPVASTNQTATVTTNGATLAFTASSALAVGAYPITISASGTGVTTNSVTFSTVVNPPVGGTANVTFTFCPASGIPVFVAAQDGVNGAWTRISAGAGSTYAFAITQSRGAVAYQYQPSANNYRLVVFYGTQTEIQSQGAKICAGQTQAAKTVNGSVVGLGATDYAYVGLGSAVATIRLETGNSFTLNNVPSGALDLLATRTTTTINGSSVSYLLASLLIRRNQSMADGATISPSVDLSATSAEAVAPVARVLSVTGLNGDQAEIGVDYNTSTGRAPLFFSASTPLTAATRTFYTMPSSKQAAGDYHELYVIAASDFTATQPSVTRFANTVFFASADKSLTLGPVPSAVTISNVTVAAPVQLNALFQVQAEYNKTFNFFMSQQGTNPRSVTLQYTAGYVGSPGTWNAVVPDLAAAGYTASWGLQPQVMTSIFTNVAGWSTPGGGISPPFVEGATYVSASRFMTYLP